MSDWDRMVEIYHKTFEPGLVPGDRLLVPTFVYEFIDAIIKEGFGDVYELKCILQTQDEQIKGKDERIETLRRRIAELEAIAERAADAEKLRKVIYENINTDGYKVFQDVTVDPISRWLLTGEIDDGR